MNFEHDEEWVTASFKEGTTPPPPTPLTIMGAIAGTINEILPSLPEGSVLQAKAKAALKSLGVLSQGHLHISEGKVMWAEGGRSDDTRTQVMHTMFEEFALPRGEMPRAVLQNPAIWVEIEACGFAEYMFAHQHEFADRLKRLGSGV